MKWYQWVLLITGLWLILSPWVLGFSAFNLPMWNSVFVGVVVIIMVLGNISESKT